MVVEQNSELQVAVSKETVSAEADKPLEPMTAEVS